MILKANSLIFYYSHYIYKTFIVVRFSISVGYIGDNNIGYILFIYCTNLLVPLLMLLHLFIILLIYLYYFYCFYILYLFILNYIEP
jgi:hypothetical protein